MEFNCDFLICEMKDGDSYYYKNGDLHREDGPAICKKEYKNIYPDTYEKNNYVLVKKTAKFSDKDSNSNNASGFMFYLEGVKMSKREFEAIELNKKLQIELKVNSVKSKKTKI